MTGTDPVKLGVVATLSNPGGNVTGVTFLHPQLDAKRLEVLQEVVPGIRRVGILFNAASATEPTNIPRWEAAARALNFEVGGLVSYGPSVSDGFRRAAGHVAKILKGAKPADIPFEQATTFELAVNLKTARALDIPIPRSVMLRADKVIQ